MTGKRQIMSNSRQTSSETKIHRNMTLDLRAMLGTLDDIKQYFRFSIKHSIYSNTTKGYTYI